MKGNELTAGLVGGLIGYIVGGSAAKGAASTGCPETVSNPLYNPAVAPVLSIEDYLRYDTFPGESKSNFWHGIILNTATANYQIVSFVDKVNLTHKVRIADFTHGTVIEHIVNDVVISEGTEIIITSGFGEVRIDTVTNTSTLDLVVSSQYGDITISISSTGKPFCYNQKNIAVLIPNTYYISGFEIPGPCTGTINGIQGDGFCDFERANWNYDVMDIWLEEWVGFETERISGVLYKHGVYYDGGIYLDGVYIKPDIWKINTYSYSNQGKTLGNQSLVCLVNGNQALRLDMKYLGNVIFENSFSISAWLNTESLGTGYAWEEFNF